MLRSVLYILTTVAILVIALFVIVTNEVKHDNLEKISSFTEIRYEGKIILKAEIRDTDKGRSKGLSGKKYLENNEGMLFVFDKEGEYGFWMKEMLFPIDIAWLDKNKTIIHIEEGVLPDTYPKVFYPGAPSLFVIESRSMFFRNNGLKIGSKLDF